MRGDGNFFVPSRGKGAILCYMSVTQIIESMKIKFKRRQRKRIRKFLSGFHGKEDGYIVECVKSNFGTAEFRPMSGRWVVERNNSWLESYRRLYRNYERYLSSARTMTYLAAILFLCSATVDQLPHYASHIYLTGRKFPSPRPLVGAFLHLFRSRWNPIAPSRAKENLSTIDRPDVNIYCRTGSKYKSRQMIASRHLSTFIWLV